MATANAFDWREDMDSKTFPAAIWSTELDELAGEDGPKTELVGVVQFDRGEIKLDIPIGCLLDWPQEKTDGGYIRYHTSDGLHADAAYGFSQRGEWFVLRDIYSPGPSESIPGFQSQVLFATSLLSARRPLKPNPVVTSVSVMVPGLREWVGKPSGRETTAIDSDGGRKAIQFDFSTDDVERVTLFGDERVRTTIEFLNIRKGGSIPSYSFEFESDCFLRIQFLQGEHLLSEAIEQWVTQTVDFVCFCMGFKYSISKLWFTTDEGVRGDYYAPFLGMKGRPSSAQLMRMPLPLRSIEYGVTDYLSKWYSFEGYAYNSSKLLVTLMNDWKMPLDMVFLATAQCFEASSRIDVDDAEISEEDLRTRLQEIKSSNLSSGTKKWACYRLHHARWKSANRLADGLLERLGPVVSFVVPDADRFKSDHRKLRDSLTHRRSLNGQESLTGEGLYWHMGAARTLSYASIAIALGIDVNLFAERLKESGYLGNEIAHSRKMYSLSLAKNAEDNELDKLLVQT